MQNGAGTEPEPETRTVGTVLGEFPNLVVSNLIVSNFNVEALFCALLRQFALFCGLAFALFCALLRSLASFYVRPRLERPRFRTAEFFQERKSELEPSEPFCRNRNRNRAIPLNCAETHRKPFPQRNRWNGKSEPLEPVHAQTVTEPHFSLPRNLAIFSTFWGDFLTQLHRKTWRERNKNPLPRNCRFLSLVVVERA